MSASPEAEAGGGRRAVDEAEAGAGIDDGAPHPRDADPATPMSDVVVQDHCRERERRADRHREENAGIADRQEGADDEAHQRVARDRLDAWGRAVDKAGEESDDELS